MFEWKYQARVNETHSWEGRQCADISVMAGDKAEVQQAASDLDPGAEEYANDELFSNYEGADEPRNGSLMDARLVNDYKPELINKTTALGSDSKGPEALPLQRETEQSNLEQGPNRQMDIPLTEVCKCKINENM